MKAYCDWPARCRGNIQAEAFAFALAIAFTALADQRALALSICCLARAFLGSLVEPAGAGPNSRNHSFKTRSLGAHLNGSVREQHG